MPRCAVGGTVRMKLTGADVPGARLPPVMATGLMVMPWAVAAPLSCAINEALPMATLLLIAAVSVTLTGPAALKMVGYDSGSPLGQLTTGLGTAILRLKSRSCHRRTTGPPFGLPVK